MLGKLRIGEHALCESDEVASLPIAVFGREERLGNGTQGLGGSAEAAECWISMSIIRYQVAYTLPYFWGRLGDGA